MKKIMRFVTVLLTLCMLLAAPLAASANDGGLVNNNTYYVSAYATDQKGTVSVSPKYAKPGTVVTITVTPNPMYTLETVTATMIGVSDLYVRNAGTNRYTFDMPDGNVEVRATFMDDNSQIGYFVGAGDSDDYYSAVLWAQRNGITTGYDTSDFNAGSPCTRSMIVTFLWRAAGCPAVSHRDHFADVDETSFYGEAVCWAACNGIVYGYGNGLFGTTDPVSNEEAVTILYRYAQYRGKNTSVAADTNILSYNDAFEISDYAMTPYQWACGEGVVKGTNGNLMPQADCTIRNILTWMYHLGR